MESESRNDVWPACGPVAEGVRFDFGCASACAVRNESRDIAVRVRRRRSAARRALERVPLVRGAARLVFSAADFFSGMCWSALMEPQQTVRGERAARIAALFRTTPQALTGLLVAVAIPAILLALLVGVPAAVEALLVQVEGLPRFAVNTICCAFRLSGLLLGVYAVCRLKLVRRLCMYRGAASKVLNAYEAYGRELTPEEVVLSPRLTDRSDGAFWIAVLLVALIAFAAHRTYGLAAQLGYRAGVLLAAAAVVGEIVRALERAHPNGIGATLRVPLVSLQHLFTIEPHAQMIEVALCAFHAACDGDEEGAEE